MPVETTSDEYAERVSAARRMTTEERLLAGARMFDARREALASCVREHFPDASERDVSVLLKLVLDYCERRDIL